MEKSRIRSASRRGARLRKRANCKIPDAAAPNRPCLIPSRQSNGTADCRNARRRRIYTVTRSYYLQAVDSIRRRLLTVYVFSGRINFLGYFHPLPFFIYYPVVVVLCFFPFSFRSPFPLADIVFLHGLLYNRSRNGINVKLTDARWFPLGPLIIHTVARVICICTLRAG